RLLTPVSDKPEPHSHGISSPLSRRERGTGGEGIGRRRKKGTGGEDRAPDVTQIHIRQPDLNPVALRVPSQRVERVEPHRLIVEERAVILGGVVVPEPCRLVR